MALQDMRNQIITEIGSRTDMNTIIDNQINFAVQEIGTNYPFLELNETATTTTVSGQFEYALPTDCFTLWSVKEETKLNRLLTFKDYKEFDMQDESKTGQPTAWTLWKKSVLVFNQVPDDNDSSNYSIRLRYWRLSSTLSNNTDVIDLPARMERGIRLKATGFVFGILQQPEKQTTAEQAYAAWLQNIALPVAGTKQESKRARANLGRGS